MPGARLSLDERGEIALGLAVGRSFADIARGLDRPTSTVSREVGRNGLVEDLGRCHPAEGLSRSSVEFVSDQVKVGLVVQG